MCKRVPTNRNKGGIKMNVDELGDRKLIFVTLQLSWKGDMKNNSV